MGYDADIDGEAYQTVSGQNSNNSVRFSDDFMGKVRFSTGICDRLHPAHRPAGSSVDREVSVRHLWDIFNESAWRLADPAPPVRRSPSMPGTPAPPVGTAGGSATGSTRPIPAAVHAFLDDTSCNLASMNVMRFFDPVRALFDIESYVHLISIAQLALEASIRGGQFPTPAIARKTWAFRATGLGLANLASLFMSAGLPYDSEEARAVGAALAGILTGQSYAVSARMAKQTAPFVHYEKNKEAMLRVIRNHSRAAGAARMSRRNCLYPAVVNPTSWTSRVSAPFPRP